MSNLITIIDIDNTTIFDPPQTLVTWKVVPINLNMQLSISKTQINLSDYVVKSLFIFIFPIILTYLKLWKTIFGVFDPNSIIPIKGAQIQKTFFLASKLWIWWSIKVWRWIWLTHRNFENQKFIKENLWPTFLVVGQKLTMRLRTL